MQNDVMAGFLSISPRWNSELVPQWGLVWHNLNTPLKYLRRVNTLIFQTRTTQPNLRRYILYIRSLCRRKSKWQAENKACLKEATFILTKCFKTGSWSKFPTPSVNRKLAQISAFFVFIKTDFIETMFYSIQSWSSIVSISKGGSNLHPCVTGEMQVLPLEAVVS